MGMSVFGIGISGMNAAQAGLTTAGHNIANASTPGFNRQQIVQTSNLPQLTGAGFIGQGVNVTTVKRLYNDALSNQLVSAQTQGSQLDAYNAQITQLANLLGDPSAGLTPALQGFFGAVSDVASNPSSVPSRQAMLSGASALVSSFQGIDQQIQQMRAGINTELAGSVSAINGYAQQIAALNHSIVVAESGSANQQANDLRDQRDQLVASLNQEVRAAVVKESDGSYDVFIGNGQPVVIGTQSYSLAATPSLEDPQRLEVGYQSGGSTVLLSASAFQGGKLGGLLSYRSNSLDPAENALGRIAIGLAQSFNAQHALGQDLNGALGGKFFNIAGPAALASSTNAGTATVSASLQNAAALTTSDYRLQYNGASGGNESFTLTRLSDGTTTAVGFPSASGYPYSLNVDGVTLTLGAGAALNDSWTIQPTRLGASSIGLALSDPATIAAASPIRTGAALNNTGNATIAAGSVSATAALPLAGQVSLTYNAALNQFTVAGPAGFPAVAPITYASGASISFNGISFSISGAPADGDVFSINRNASGVADNRNALALGQLQTTNTLGQNAGVAGSQPSATFQSAYSQIVSQVGNTARQIDVTSKAQRNMVAQAQQAQQSASGVNLDEEAANLLRYQQAYQASGKMMQIASTLFQSVLDLGK